jgi:hypothetical protein
MTCACVVKCCAVGMFCEYPDLALCRAKTFDLLVDLSIDPVVKATVDPAIGPLIEVEVGILLLVTVVLEPP